MIYVLLGGPATGKGTRSEKLSKAKGIPHISTGELLREKAKTDSDIDARLKKGMLISDDIVTEILEERITKDDCKEGFILDGYPRTYNQTQLLDKLLAKYNKKITKVIELVVPDELAFKRILQRRECDTCGKTYGIDFPPMVDGICDECGGHLSIRTDDTEETLAKRIKTYKENVGPILDFYREKGLLKTVDSSFNPDGIIFQVDE